MSVLRVQAYAASDVGLVRQGNEDSFLRGATVFAVADGMGGHLAGEVASKAAVGPLRALDGQDFADDETTESHLVEAIRQANNTVVHEASANPDHRGMGTTLTAAIVRNGRLHLAHVGDSRAYLLRRGEAITQLTTDHTLVEQLIQEGRLSRDQAAVHPQRSVITRAIGVDADVQVDTLAPITLQPGDQVLLCSDGLSGPVDDDTIADILLATTDGQEACEHLINAANDAGGPDNVTVVLLRAEPGARTASPGGPVAGGAAGTGVLTSRDTEEGHDTAPLAISAPASPDDASGGRDGTARDGAHDGRTRPYGARDDIGAGRRPRSRTRRAATVGLATVLLVGLGTAAAWVVLSRTYFVGVSDGQVAVYNGLPQEVASLRLYWLTESSDVAVVDLQPRFQNALAEGITVGSLSEARRTVADYRADVEEQRAAASEAPTPSPTGAPEAFGPFDTDAAPSEPRTGTTGEPSADSTSASNP